ncbi:MAG: DUF3800 domain-containing protein [Desulfobulbaceae bacterium]|nr:DUF3800 domain-containing protein [Desulfobulbaceae bacterium]
MTIYFSFSDENGSYNQIRSRRFINAHPYYARCSYLILADDWKKISQKHLLLKRKHNLPIDKEIKWSYLWSLYKYERSNKEIPPEKPFYFLRDTPINDLTVFIEDTLSLLADLSFIKIIITVTENSTCNNINELYFYKMHIQEHMQRIEMEMQVSEENLCVLFIDPLSEDKNKYLRNTYNQLFTSGDFINNYKHIKDSLNLEYSHHSIGVQLADFISGCFVGFLKGYETSKNLFFDQVLCKLRKNSNGEVMGYGVREVPRNQSFRNEIKRKMDQF